MPRRRRTPPPPPPSAPPLPTTSLRTARALLVVASAVALGAACGASGGAPRFALRAPVVAETDRPLARAPRPYPNVRVTDGVDQMIFWPLAHALAVDPPSEARDVNALDEVPDSSWFTNRGVVTPERAALGACAGVPEVAPPLAFRRLKQDGTTPGFFVRDATGRDYVVKLDNHPEDRPETSTAADAIVSRIYWTVGYNTPCNRVYFLAPEQFVAAPGATEVDARGRREPLDLARARDLLARHGVRRASDGAVRVSASLVLPGELLGPWPGTGVREDDPNDLVPHEHRRELRGERLLAAWLNHWDAREINSLDAFVREPSGGGGGGRVVHYMMDFGDSLGGRTFTRERSQRLGHAGIVVMPWQPRPWLALETDSVAPNLGYFGTALFDPGRWEPILPLARFALARPEDEGWMARRIARVTPAHLAAVVATARFASPQTSARLLEILVARRARTLAWAFARSSPLGELALEGAGAAAPGAQRLCAVDLAVLAGVARADRVRYATAWTAGGGAPALEASAEGRVCVALPPHFAPARAPDDAPARYAVLTVARRDGATGATTTLRAHLYDLGPARGYRLAGVER